MKWTNAIEESMPPKIGTILAYFELTLTLKEEFMCCSDSIEVCFLRVMDDIYYTNCKGSLDKDEAVLEVKYACDSNCEKKLKIKRYNYQEFTEDRQYEVHHIQKWTEIDMTFKKFDN